MKCYLISQKFPEHHQYFIESSQKSRCNKKVYSGNFSKLFHISFEWILFILRFKFLEIVTFYLFSFYMWPTSEIPPS